MSAVILSPNVTAPENVTKSDSKAPWAASVTVIVAHKTAAPELCAAGVVSDWPRKQPCNTLLDIAA